MRDVASSQSLTLLYIHINRDVSSIAFICVYDVCGRSGFHSITSSVVVHHSISEAMLEFAVLISVLVLAGVELRRRSSHKSHDDPDKKSDASEKESPEKPSAATTTTKDYCVSLLIPCIVGLLLLLAYYAIPPTQIRSLLKIQGCIPPSPDTRATDWDYRHNTAELHNVSGSPVAQVLFNQGVLLRWGYTLEGSHQAFETAISVDASCAMCHWGIAYAASPFANIVALPDSIRYPHFSTDMNREARRFLQKAEELPKRSLKEAKYIDAMWIRFPEVQEVERKHQEWLEFMHGARMLDIWKEDPADLIAGALAIEAFVNCMPWDYYIPHLENRPSLEDISWSDLIDQTFPDQQNGKAQFTAITKISFDNRVFQGLPLDPAHEAKKVQNQAMRPLARVVEQLVLRALEMEEAHPMVTHLHIHLTEASMADEPGKAFLSASKLDAVSHQWKSAHLVHMPSHTFYRVGEYAKAVKSNELAYLVDIETSQKYCAHTYVPEHNVKVLVAAASMGGLLQKAEEYAHVLRGIGKKITLRKYLPDGWDYVSLVDIWGQFGQWDKILQMDMPSDGARGGTPSEGLIYSTAIYHFSRYMALTHRPIRRAPRALLTDADANVELAAFQEAAAKVSKRPNTVPGEGLGIYSAAYYERIQVASHYTEIRASLLKGNTVCDPQTLPESRCDVT